MNSRELVIQISKDLQLSHVGSNLTALPIIERIYAEKQPEDKVVISSGHAHLAHAVVLQGKAGMVQGEAAKESIIQHGIHCDRQAGCDVSTGSLGQGLPIAVGLALADRSRTTYCLVSDGEMAEGSVLEALRIAAEQQVANLKVFCNANGYGAYRQINRLWLERQIKAAGFPVEVVWTDPNLGNWAVGLAQHYKVADNDL